MKKFLVALVSIFAATMAAAQSGYQIQAGDTLQIEVIEDPSLNRSVLVLPDGNVSFPFAGSVQAKGRTAGQVGQAITSGIESNFASKPNVFVTVETLTLTPAGRGSGTIHVYMMGEIATPGEKHMRRGITVLQALAESGGFTKFAATKRILVRRGGQVMKVNYKAIASGSTAGRDVVLREGDVIIVPERRLFE